MFSRSVTAPRYQSSTYATELTADLMPLRWPTKLILYGRTQAGHSQRDPLIQPGYSHGQKKTGRHESRELITKMSAAADIPFWENATEASLMVHPDGWHLVLISDRDRESVFASRGDVGDAILHENLGNKAAVFDHFEERLWAAGYESVRMAPERGALAAWWLSPVLPSDL